jgi:hypothetical protein
VGRFRHPFFLRKVVEAINAAAGKRSLRRSNPARALEYVSLRKNDNNRQKNEREFLYFFKYIAQHIESRTLI